MADDNKPDMNALKGLREEATDLALALSGPIGTLATGGSKAQAAWSGFKAVMEVNVLGPLYQATFGAAGVGNALLAAARSAETLAEGLKELARMDTLRAQFETIMGSSLRAKQRMEELSNFAKTAPFSMPDIANANRDLESLTGGMMATQEQMTKIGDAASATGNSFSDVADSTGKIYASLQNGTPYERPLTQLISMGIVSQDTARQIQHLQTSGVDWHQSMNLITADMERFKGGMDTASKTVLGLQTSLAQAHAEMAAKVSAGSSPRRGR